jgi:hypothetical protein
MSSTKLCFVTLAVFLALLSVKTSLDVFEQVLVLKENYPTACKLPNGEWQK